MAKKLRLTVDVRGHIVFDCDGTLISSVGDVFSAVSEILTEFFNRPVTEEEVKDKFDADIEILYANFGITGQADFQTIQKMWLKHSVTKAHSYQLFPGIKELLQALKAKNFALYVWTARDRVSAELILKNLEINEYFWELRSGTCGLVKPHPQGIEEMVGQMDPQSVVMIGDSYVDITGGKAFGAHTLGALWCPLANEEKINSERPSQMVRHPREVLSFIENLFPIKENKHV